jgi:hypothetical protein
MTQKNRQSDIPRLTASLDKLAIALEKKNSLDEKKLMLEHKKFLFEQHKFKTRGGKSTPVYEDEKLLDLDNLKITDFRDFPQDEK